MSGYGPDQLLCHHGDDEAGHANTAACPVLIKVGRYAQPDLRQLVEAEMPAPVRSAIRELQAGRRCVVFTKDGTLCGNRPSLMAWPDLLCGVHR